MTKPRILLIVGGGIAANKSIELVRLLRKSGHIVRCVITRAGEQFVTPLTLAALSENKVYTNLFDLKDEVEMGHIQLSREADLVVVAVQEPVVSAHGLRGAGRRRHFRDSGVRSGGAGGCGRNGGQAQGQTRQTKGRRDHGAASSIRRRGRRSDAAWPGGGVRR